MTILFVCTGNTCRSPMAEGYFRWLCAKSGCSGVTVSSAGVSATPGFPASVEAVSLMGRLGIDISSHASSSLTADRVAAADLIVVMSRSHRKQVLRLDPSAMGKSWLLLEFGGVGGEVPDPVGGGRGEYEACFDLMRRSLDALFEELKRPGGQGGVS